MSETPDPTETALARPPIEALLLSLLDAYQLQAQLTDRLQLCGSWDEPEPEAHFAWFHLVEAGRCQIRADCLAQPITLEAGDVIFFPGGASHNLCSPLPASDCTLLCGELHFNGALALPLMRALPACILLRAAQAGAAVLAVGSLLRQELHDAAIGHLAVINKVCDALFVLALRQHLQNSPHQVGLLAALTDTRLAPALAAIHSHPGRPHTVASLAEAGHSSRAAFAQRFQAILGEPPMRYLTRWRMVQAATRLRDPRLSVSTVAADLGFETEAAFRRAFKRVHGQGPGALRRSNRNEHVHSL